MPMENIDVINKTGMKKLSEETVRPLQVHGGILVETKECTTLGKNSGSHNLHGTDYVCRQQTLSFPGEDPVNSGCSCYVQN